jgi:hypothetical protein
MGVFGCGLTIAGLVTGCFFGAANLINSGLGVLHQHTLLVAKLCTLHVGQVQLEFADANTKSSSSGSSSSTTSGSPYCIETIHMLKCFSSVALNEIMSYLYLKKLTPSWISPSFIVSV